MKKLVFALEPLSCPSCIQKIETALNRQPGVTEAKVLFHSSKIRIQFDQSIVQPDLLRQVVTRLGYPVIAQKVS